MATQDEGAGDGEEQVRLRGVVSDLGQNGVNDAEQAFVLDDGDGRVRAGVHADTSRVDGATS